MRKGASDGNVIGLLLFYNVKNFFHNITLCIVIINPKYFCVAI